MPRTAKCRFNNLSLKGEIWGWFPFLGYLTKNYRIIFLLPKPFAHNILFLLREVFMNLKKLLTGTVTAGILMLSCSYINAMKPAGDKSNTFKPDPILNAPRNTSNHKKKIIMLKNGDVSTVYEYITEVDFGNFAQASEYYDWLKANGCSPQLAIITPNLYPTKSVYKVRVYKNQTPQKAVRQFKCPGLRKGT